MKIAKRHDGTEARWHEGKGALAALVVMLGLLLGVPCRADDPATRPTGAGSTDKLPHIRVDLAAKKIAVDCQALNVNIPLEFFCVTDGGNEHESVLRTPAKPSDIHFALLMLGLTPGSPATYLPTRKLWVPPHGPPLHLTCHYLLNGKAMDVPAYRLMRSVKTKKEMPPSVWVFDGSRVMPDGVYAADITGYVVSICNFDLTLIDVPELVSNANETLEWEFNPDLVPPKGTDVELIFEPAGASELPKEAAGISADKFNPGPGLSASPASPDVPAAAPDATTSTTRPTSDSSPDGADVDQLLARWNASVLPQRGAIRQAAEAHYQIIAQLRAQQQRLIDQADKIQRAIDDLERRYQDMSTPRPQASDAKESADSSTKPAGL